jgi:hypothetical protein
MAIEACRHAIRLHRLTIDPGKHQAARMAPHAQVRADRRPAVPHSMPIEMPPSETTSDTQPNSYGSLAKTLHFINEAGSYKLKSTPVLCGTSLYLTSNRQP